MSGAGWFFMVGLRVFDVLALVVWLVWFFKLRESEPEEQTEDDGGEEFQRRWSWSLPEDPPPVPSGPPALDLPKPDAEPWPSRRRDHAGDREPSQAPARRPSRPPRAPTRR
jgi:hypothetical protein